MSQDSQTDGQFKADWDILSKYYPTTDLLPSDNTNHCAQIAVFEDNIHANGRYTDALLGDPQRPFEKVFSVLYDYLNWYKSGSHEYDYLYYGKKSLPSCFDDENLLEALNNLIGYVIR